MALLERLTNRVRYVLNQPWSIRRGFGVPRTSGVTLVNGGVELVATMLYADLADSTLLATYADPKVAAKVIKVFLGPVCDIIREHAGDIRSFDGDRVMGVFIGPNRNDRAVRAALHINQAMHFVIRPAVEQLFPGLRAAGFLLHHGVGIDEGQVMAVRAGVRDHNDLAWIGRAPNVAAKLSAIRDSQHSVLITNPVFQDLSWPMRMSPDGSLPIWTTRNWPSAPAPEVATVYGTAWGHPLPQARGLRRSI